MQATRGTTAIDWPSVYVALEYFDIGTGKTCANFQHFSQLSADVQAECRGEGTGTPAKSAAMREYLAKRPGTPRVAAGHIGRRQARYAKLLALETKLAVTKALEKYSEAAARDDRFRAELAKIRRNFRREAERRSIVARSSFVKSVTWTTTGPATGTVEIRMGDTLYAYHDVQVERYGSFWRSARTKGIDKAYHRTWKGPRTGKPAGHSAQTDLRYAPEQDLSGLMLATLAVWSAS